MLLLDEPTFGQDARNTFVMLEQLRAVEKKWNDNFDGHTRYEDRGTFCDGSMDNRSREIEDIQFSQEKKRKENANARMVHTR